MAVQACGAEGTVDMAATETGSAAWSSPRPGGGSTVSVVVAMAIVVADMVGVGVFTSLGFEVKDIPPGFSILLLWTIGGEVALGWVSAAVGFAAPVAHAAMAFGEDGKSVVPGAEPLALAIGVVWLVSLVQLA